MARLPGRNTGTQLERGIARDAHDCDRRQLFPCLALRPGTRVANRSAVLVPDGQPVTSDSFTIGEGPLPPSENKAIPFERPIEPWVRSTAEEGTAIALAEAKRRQEEREAASRLSAPPVIPKGQWCGEEGVICGDGEVALLGTSIAVQSNGMTIVKLKCTGGENCSGNLVLSVKKASEVKGGKKRARKVTIGATAFSIATAATTSVKIKLDAAGRGLLHTGGGAPFNGSATLEIAPVEEHAQTTNVHLTRAASHDRTGK